MNTILITLTFFGFFLTYNTSKRATLSNDLFLEKWIQGNPILSKWFGLGFLVLTFILTIYVYGLGGGTLVACITLMTIGSLITCVYPLRIFNYRFLLIMALVSMLLEFFTT